MFGFTIWMSYPLAAMCTIFSNAFLTALSRHELESVAHVSSVIVVSARPLCNYIAQSTPTLNVVRLALFLLNLSAGNGLQAAGIQRKQVEGQVPLRSNLKLIR